jgi:hypothetical protein
VAAKLSGHELCRRVQQSRWSFFNKDLSEKDKRSEPGQPKPQSSHFSIRIYLRKSGFLSLASQNPNWSFFNTDLIERKKRIRAWPSRAPHWSFVNKERLEKDRESAPGPPEVCVGEWLLQLLFFFILRCF